MVTGVSSHGKIYYVYFFFFVYNDYGVILYKRLSILAYVTLGKNHG
jgi:hypothetical protein